MAEGHVDMLANVENAVWHAFDFLGKNIFIFVLIKADNERSIYWKLLYNFRKIIPYLLYTFAN
jgi:hypothetical protein